MSTPLEKRWYCVSFYNRESVAAVILSSVTSLGLKCIIKTHRSKTHCEKSGFFSLYHKACTVALGGECNMCGCLPWMEYFFFGGPGTVGGH